MVTRTIKLSDIKIPEKFLSHPPKRAKIDERKERAKKKPPVVAVNSRGWLTDLYASYVAAKELGMKEIKAIPGKDSCTVVYATFASSPKEYAWAVPEKLKSEWAESRTKLAPGLKIAVMTKHGPKQAKIVRIAEEPYPTEHSDVLGVWSMVKFKPAQHAEHERLCGQIADYCKANRIRTLEGFIEAAGNDGAALPLYQFATGQWANEARKSSIRAAIKARLAED